MNHIITYFYLEPKDSISIYGVQEKRYEKKNEYYFRCIVNFFLSSLEYNKDTQHYFICNETEDIEFIPNFSFCNFCKNNGIKLIKRNAKYVKAQEKWAGSMYLFDAIESFRKEYLNYNDNFIFFDNDILIHDSFEKIDIFNKGFDWIGYDITNEYIKDNRWVVDFNNISKNMLENNAFKPFGGEFLFLKGSFIEEFKKTFSSIYPMDGLNTEEHYLSYIFSVILKEKNNGTIINKHLKRIWTTFKYNNKTKEDSKLKILHLPSEKQYGLYWLNKELLQNRRYSKERALMYTGIKKRSLYIMLKLCIKKVINKLL